MASAVSSLQTQHKANDSVKITDPEEKDVGQVLDFIVLI